MKLITVLTLLMTFSIGFAQCPPVETLIKKRKIKDEYSLNSQSRVGNVAPDENYEMSFIAHPGLDYRLSTILGEGSIGTLTYEVYELVVEKRIVDGKETFKRVKRVLANSGAEPFLEFSSDQVRKIFINVHVAGGEKKKLACVGVIIETKRSVKTGF